MRIEFHKHTYELPKIAQYEDIEYAACLCCPDCSEGMLYNWSEEMKTDKVLGFCENKFGEYEIVLECKHCHKKYRFHMAKRWGEGFVYDAEYWKHQVGLFLFINNHEYLEVKS